MSKFLNRKSSLRLLSCIMAFCMCITAFANTVGFYASAEGTESITVWDGKTDNYSSLDAVLTDLGAADSDGYYHIKTANQLYGVIKYGGGGNSYKLDNDLYLNADWENSENWAYGNKDLNDWTFAGGTLGEPTYKFYGTIDGCGHTVYGLYSDVDDEYNGLIGAVSDTTVIKNLNVWHSYIRSVRTAGIIVGGNQWQYCASGTMTITFDGCSVRYATIDNVWNNAPSGALIGMTSRTTNVNNCSVADVKFVSGANATDYNAYGCYGSFVGALYANTSADTSVYNAGQGKQVVISNSYAVDVVNASNNNAPVYVCGLYCENATNNTWTFSITANNVYTDATAVSTNTAGTVKLLVSSDGTTAIDPTSADYPIKTITADGIKGDLAKTAMPDLNWKCWTVVENDYPVYNELEVWDGKTDDYSSLDAVLTDLGAADSDGYYHIKTANQLYGVIKYNGGGNSYKLDNDLYLNADYENSANWTYGNAPANEWAFNSSSWTNPQYKFYGTIDGCGHTIYGLYSNNDSAYNGLIGTAYDTTVIKNLNVWHSFVRGVRSTGIIIGGNFYNSPGTATITVEGCSVRYATIDNIWNNSPSGGIIGITTRKTTINNCSVADIKFVSGASATDHNAYGCYGSFVGALYANTSADTSVYNAGQGKQVVINNSYAVDVVNASNNNAPVYVCGLYAETAAKWCFSITANDVYTDATTVSTSTDGNVKLLVSLDGATAIDPSSADYPIKTITADGIKGGLAKTAMPSLNWNAWKTVDGDYPVYSPIEIWDGEEEYASLEDVLAELTVDTDNYYHITNADQLHAVIRLGGGGNKYMLDNDLYLNDNWENYQSWTNSNPAPNDWGLSGTGYSFSGTIDGDNHAIYGYFNRASATNKEYVGLIPVVNWNSGDTQSVTIKNLDMLYCSQQGNTASGFFIGATHWVGSGSVTIEGCTVKNGFLNLIWNDNLAGGFVGRVAGNTPVTIKNSAVENIVFDAQGDGSGYSGYSTLGSFVGSTYANTNAEYKFDAGQAKAVQIYNSYAYDCVNKKTGEPVYICGIYRENAAKETYSYCVTAKNVYTDATVIPTSADGKVTLLVSEDGVTENNTVKVPTADNYAGLFESGAWYMGEFGVNNPILKSRTANFAYLDITGDGIEDNYNSLDYVTLRKKLFETKGFEYILADVNYDDNVDILDIVKLKNILLGK